MSPEMRAWMRPEDLVLHQLDQLPWPAYLCLVTGFFKDKGYRIRLIRSYDDRVEHSMVSVRGERQLLMCCSSRLAERSGCIAHLRSSMDQFQVCRAVLATPSAFANSVVEKAHGEGIELLSANRLRANIEQLDTERRRQLLDTIRAKPQASVVSR